LGTKFWVHTLFQKQLSRTFPITEAITPYEMEIQNNTADNIVFKENFLSRVNRFPGLYGTCISFTGLSNPGKFQDRI